MEHLIIRIFFKKEHPLHPNWQIPGKSFFTGDEPWSVLTGSQLYNDRHLVFSESEMDVKVATIREAIDAYVPNETFTHFLKYFRANLSLPSHKEALKSSTERMSYVIERFNSDRITNTELDEEIEINGARRSERGSNLVRDYLGRSEYLDSAYKHPTMLLAFAIYHAAHRSYLTAFREAVKRNVNLEPEERANANFVLDSNSFNQFNHFLLFDTMLPLSLRELEKSKGEISEEEAVHSAWKTFFKNDVLTRTFPLERPRRGGGSNVIVVATEDHKRIEKARMTREQGGHAAREDTRDVTITCPARTHLKEGARDRLIESTIRYIEENKSKDQVISNSRRDVAEAARKAAGVSVIGQYLSR